MLSIKEPAKNAIRQLDEMYGIKNPVVVFGMAALFIDVNGAMREAFHSSNEIDMKEIAETEWDLLRRNMDFSLELHMCDRSEVSEDEVVAIDGFEFEIPSFLSEYFNESWLCYEGNKFLLRDHAGFEIRLPVPEQSLTR
jgi:hypothetical protein